MSIYYQCNILPRLRDQEFLEVDLGIESDLLTIAKGPEGYPSDPSYPSGPTRSSGNPMKTIAVQDELLAYLQRKYRTKYTIGGYLEDRSRLWAGFEESEKMLHLGVDINNLVVGEPVSIPCPAVVIHVFKDDSKMNGWGGRLIFKMEHPYRSADYLLYGHLDHDLPPVGTVFKKGDIVGRIGNSNENGGWFLHLHVQLVTQLMIDRFQNDLRFIDGYLLDKDNVKPEEVSADPTFLICSDLIYPTKHFCTDPSCASICSARID